MYGLIILHIVVKIMVEAEVPRLSLSSQGLPDRVTAGARRGHQTAATTPCSALCPCSDLSSSAGEEQPSVLQQFFVGSDCTCNQKM